MQAIEFVESYFNAWNHHDAMRVAEHLAADGTYCDIPDQQQHSRDELVASLTRYFASNNHRYELIGEILTGRDSIAFQYHVSSSGALPGGFFGAEFITLDKGGAIRILDYYNMPGVLLSGENTHPVSNGTSRRKYSRSGLTGEQMEVYKHRLEHQMKVEMAFLKPDLTLPGLAERVGCSVNHLSQVINSGFGMGFFDYMNHYRVEHAKQLLSGRDSRHRSVLSIAFAAGFNSHSSFYAAFRKAAGQTPAQFRISTSVESE